MRVGLERAVRQMVLLLLLPAITGCSPVWGGLNRTPLETDVREVLTKASQDPPELECKMIGTTRSGFCTLEQDDDGALAWAQGLGLDPRLVDLDSPETVPPVAAEGKVGCLSPEVLEHVDGLPAYWIGGRPDVLALQSGGQFEYLLLVVDPDTGQACMQVSYAYG